MQGVMRIYWTLEHIRYNPAEDEYERYLCRGGGRLVLDGKVELELSWELILWVESVRKIYSTDTAICMDLGERRYISTYLIYM